jgi:serine/threonine-protein kinase
MVMLALGVSASIWAQIPCSTVCTRYEQGKCVEYTHYPCTSESPSGPSRSYGAIAYSRSSGAYGYSHEHGNRASAEKAALKHCAEKARDCKAIVWFYNKCAEVAADGNVVGWAVDGDANRAAAKAVEQCIIQGGKKCEPKISHCSR